MDPSDHGDHQKKTIDPEYERKFAELIENIEDWDQLTKKLIAYTIRKHGERARRYGRSPEDYAQEAITAALEMRHIYNFESGKTFAQFLMSSIDSDISHQIVRPIHNTVGLERRNDYDDERPLSGYDEGKLVADDRPDRVIEKIDAERFNETIPADLRRLHELNQSTDLTAREKAKILDTTEAEVWNMQRRLRRHLKKKPTDDNESYDGRHHDHEEQAQRAEAPDARRRSGEHRRSDRR